MAFWRRAREAVMRGSSNLRLGASFALVILAARALEVYIWASGSLTNPPSEGYGWIPAYLEREAEAHTFPPYKAFLEDVVLANLGFFLALTYVVGIVLAVLLALGIFSNLTGLLVTLWAANLAFGAFPVGDEPPYTHLLLVPALLWASAFGRFWGVDAWLRPRMLSSERRWVRTLGRIAT
jgi:hypothetical protein